MKRVLMVTLAMLLIGLLIIAGCSQPAATSTNPQTKAPAQTQAPGTTGALSTSTPGSSSTGPATGAKPIELKFSSGSPPPPSGLSTIDATWVKLIEERTAAIGKPVKFTFYWAEALGKMGDQYNLLGSGFADVVAPWGPQHFPGRMPGLEVLQLPCLFPSSEIASQVTWELIQKRPELQKETSEAKLLYYHSSPTSGISMRSKQIKTFDDIKGLKIAARPGVTSETVKALGGVPVGMGVPDTYAALQSGVLDGGIINWEAQNSFKWYEVTKFRSNTPVGLFTDPLALSMSWSTWNKLPPEVQKIFEATDIYGVGGSQKAGKSYDDFGVKALDTIKAYDQKAGNPEVYNVPKDDFLKWTAAVTPLYDAWIKSATAKGLPAQAIFDDLQSIIKKYNK